MNARIHFPRLTGNALHRALHQAYVAGDRRLLRRSSALLEFGANNLAVSRIVTKWHIARSTFYDWVSDFLRNDLASLLYPDHGGRPPRLTDTPKKRLCEWLAAGPPAAGFEAACWSTVLVQELIRREWGVLYNRNSIGALLPNLGYSLQKAQFVSDHLDETRRSAWRTQDWPAILRVARQRRALLLFGAAVSFPQWGSLSDTWSRLGQTPPIQTSGKRKGSKVFGLLEFFSGRLFYQGIEGKFNSEAYQAFRLSVLAHTREPLIRIQEGARYHTAKATQTFFAAPPARVTVFQLPSYAPDSNPIEYVWRKTKKLATHNKYFAEFVEVIQAVAQALAKFARCAPDVLALFGFYCAESGLPRAFAS